MSPREFYGGVIRSGVWTVVFDVHLYHSERFTGFKIPDEVFDALVDAGVETIVFVDPNRGRYTSSIDDWLESGVDEGGFTHLRQSWMDYG